MVIITTTSAVVVAVVKLWSSSTAASAGQPTIKISNFIFVQIRYQTTFVSLISVVMTLDKFCQIK